jgi:hypothetical protein
MIWETFQTAANVSSARSRPLSLARDSSTFSRLTVFSPKNLVFIAIRANAKVSPVMAKHFVNSLVANHFATFVLCSRTFYIVRCSFDAGVGD